MSEKSASPAATEESVPSIKIDLSATKLSDIKGERQDQFKKSEKANNSPHLYLNDTASSHMYLNVDTTSLSSAQQHASSIRSLPLSQHSAFDFAPPIDSLPPPADKKPVKAWPAMRSMKNVHRSESVTLTTERNHKPKHHQHRHHHCSGRKRRHSCHRRHSYQPPSNSNEGQQNQTTHSSPKVIVANSTTDASQQPVLVYRQLVNNKGQTISLPLDANGESIMLENQQKPSVVYRDSSVQPNTEINANSSRKKQKGNIPLQSVENKIVSRRTASQNEAQVESYPQVICTEPCSNIINSCGVQDIERIYYEDDCCSPSSFVHCASNSCIPQQYDPFVCLPQQQQQQILLSTEPATSSCDFVQQMSCSPQHPQYVYVDSGPATIVSQVPACSPISTTIHPHPYLCAPQTSCSPPTQILIQQQPQATTQSFQIIETPQVQTGQILNVTSAAPALASIQPQIIQAIHAPTQVVAASPQILYRRSYDPTVLQLESQHVSIANSPLATLSQPCYVPQRRVTVRPSLFQSALARTVSDRTGVPACFPPGTNVLADIPVILSPGRRLASTASGLSNDDLPGSKSMSIRPMTANGLLIPFKPSTMGSSTNGGLFSGSGSYPSGARNLDHIRQQIQQRARFLADFKQNNLGRLPPIRTNFASPTVLSRAPSSLPVTNMPTSAPLLTSNPQPLSSRSSLPVPPPLVNSQTPYARGDIFGSSNSGSSSRSSISSTSPISRTRASASGLSYARASLPSSRPGSTSSGPFTPYQSLRP
ncbi:unnamed protein product [Adineta ricciae]|uniref:Uncharacterized protein n=1 Tax=Adineta ricciae TaxID=249248 RepID=A0A814BI89_ADIRI|nr:unnamed protein product [Adineta ricciae]